MKSRLMWSIASLCSWCCVANAQTDASPLRVTGFVESAYAFSNHDGDRTIVGNLYLPRHDEFLLSAAQLRVERPIPTDRVGTGFMIEAMAGRHATAVRAAGLDLGDHADLVQAFGTLHWPAAALQVSVGKMATMLGKEVIQGVYNPNPSRGALRSLDSTGLQRLPGAVDGCAGGGTALLAVHVPLLEGRDGRPPT